MTNICPCGSGKLYLNCCEPFITNKKNAPTAEKLMRSRYTAFTFANIDYLLKTHHPKTRPTKEKKDIKKWAQSVKWIRLTVVKTELCLKNNAEGKVEFKAVFIENGIPNQIHELSSFVKENSKWFYLDGIHLS